MGTSQRQVDLISDERGVQHCRQYQRWCLVIHIRRVAFHTWQLASHTRSVDPLKSVCMCVKTLYTFTPDHVTPHYGKHGTARHVASTPLASPRLASPRHASPRIASHRIASHHIARCVRLFRVSVTIHE